MGSTLSLSLYTMMWHRQLLATTTPRSDRVASVLSSFLPVDIPVGEGNIGTYHRQPAGLILSPLGQGNRAVQPTVSGLREHMG